MWFPHVGIFCCGRCGLWIVLSNNATRDAPQGRFTAVTSIRISALLCFTNQGRHFVCETKCRSCLSHGLLHYMWAVTHWANRKGSNLNYMGKWKGCKIKIFQLRTLKRRKNVRLKIFQLRALKRRNKFKFRFTWVPEI